MPGRPAATSRRQRTTLCSALNPAPIVAHPRSAAADVRIVSLAPRPTPAGLDRAMPSAPESWWTLWGPVLCLFVPLVGIVLGVQQLRRQRLALGLRRCSWGRCAARPGGYSSTHSSEPQAPSNRTRRLAAAVAPTQVEKIATGLGVGDVPLGPECVVARFNG